MTKATTELLCAYYDGHISWETIQEKIPAEILQDYETVSAQLREAIRTTDAVLLKAAITLYDFYERKTELEEYFNQLIITPNHSDHQRLVKHLQDELKYPSAVPFIEKALQSGFNYLEYTGSEAGAIAKWFSHALNSIGTPEAIALMEKYANADDAQVADEMRYRLVKGKHWEKSRFESPDTTLAPLTEQQKAQPEQGRFFQWISRLFGSL